MCTWYKYNITLYNLIAKKDKGFVTCENQVSKDEIEVKICKTFWRI